MEDYGFASRPIANPAAVVSGETYRLTILADGLLRYEWSADGHFEDRASTFAINRDLPVPEFTVDDSDMLEIETARFRLTYDKQRPSPGGLIVDLKGKFSEGETVWRYGDFNSSLGGTARTLDNIDGRISLGPGVISKLGFAAIDDSGSMVFDAEGWGASRRPGDRIDGYLFAYARDYKAAIKALYAISGRQPLLPRWTLGNWWSRFHRYSADEYIALMDKFTEEGIPLSVAVLDMDWHLVDDERVTTSEWTGYSWNRKLFPDPRAFKKELQQRRLKLTLNDHPADGIHAFEDQYNAMAAALGHDTQRQRPIPFNPGSPEYMKAYLGILHRGLEDDGCDFWWIDWQQGEHSRTGIDPLWLLNHYHFLDSAHDGRQPLIFSRYAGPGSHRYPIGFSGDTVVSWASLDFQPEFTATASNIGYGWWSHDIGGHMFGSRDDELVTRWVQLGVFSPVMRLHSSNSRWQSKEPWYYRVEARLVMTKFLQLRHRMIPYLHTMNVRAASEDEPLVQPMYWKYPALKEAYKLPNQYTFGSELMVCPVTKPRDSSTNLASVRVWFPPGAARYVDIFTGLVYDGGRELEIFRPLGEMPVFAAEGSIIPLDAAAVPENGGHNPSALEVTVVVGKSGRFEVVENPGDDVDASESASRGVGERRFTIQWDQEEARLTATSTSSSDKAWTFRFFRLAENVTPSEVSVSIDGKAISGASVTITRHAEPDMFGLDISVPALTISRGKTGLDITVQFLRQDPQLAVFDIEPRINQLLLDYQTDFGTKDAIWRIAVEKEASLASRVGELVSLGAGQKIIGPILELLVADSRM
ncbi:putative alpha-xylosidase [Ilyonectria robusta]|uniref:putative alpha-xylosidase n=1 Tax=Ilyonectria robusta TaxID=1079257 RepID=UPI001E8CBDB7|nr:putative alpha-xylosidase [Ilyonectria robusta]KAH8663789.1 putative alpha-xylosidase [Ilyonectria robusta]